MQAVSAPRLLPFSGTQRALPEIVSVSLMAQRGGVHSEVGRSAYSLYESQVENEENGTRFGQLRSRLLSTKASTRRVMLKISGSSMPGQATLQLAGRLVGEWVDELKRAYALARAEHGQVILDFADVVFVDRTGAALIRSLVAEGMFLINCSRFITEQLKQSSSGKNADDNKS